MTELSKSVNTAADENQPDAIPTLKNVVENMSMIGPVPSGAFKNGKVYGTSGAKRKFVVLELIKLDSLNKQEFKKEFEIGQKLYPNVYLDYDVDKSRMLCKYGGDDLYTYLINNKNLDFPQRVTIVKAVMAEVKRIHGMGYKHLDLKCENILINFDDSGKPVITVIDFGMSTTEDELDVSQGTPGSSPPEVVFCVGNNIPEENLQEGEFRNYKTIPVDVYSLGSLIFTVFTNMSFLANNDPLGFKIHTYPVQHDSMIRDCIMECYKHHEKGTQILDLVTGMTQRNVSKRLTLDQAITHPLLNLPVVNVSSGFNSDKDTRRTLSI